QKAPKSSAPADMLDFVDDPPKDADKKKRPAPPMLGKAPDAGQEPTLGGENPKPSDDVPPQESKAEKQERKKKEREERTARERQEKKRPTEIRGAGRVCDPRQD